ncbi:MAG: FG-GAP repeat domain-containing protein, partial [Verrucomicrobiales bacterium]
PSIAIGQASIEILATAESIPSSDARAMDLDSDGDLDLVFGPGPLARLNSHLYWHENLGDQTFADLQLRTLSLIPAHTVWQSSLLVPLDGNRGKEFLINASSPHSWSSGDPPILYQAYPFHPESGLGPAPLAEANEFPWNTVDFDDDGIAELFQFQGAWDEEWKFVGYRRTDTGEFTEALSLTLTPNQLDLNPVEFVEAIDLDLDGDLDLSLRYSYGYHVILQRTGPNSFDPEPILVGGTSLTTSWADLDGDGLKDILTWDAGWQKNLGGLQFETQPRHSFHDELRINGHLYHLSDRPGELGLLHAVTYSESGDIELIRTPITSEEPLVRQRLTFSDEATPYLSYPLSWADLDGNGYDDLILRAGDSVNSGEYLLVVWGHSSGFSTPQSLQPPTSQPDLHVADFDGDGFPDFILGPDEHGHFHLRLNDQKGNFPTSRQLDELRRDSEPQQPNAIIAVGDLSGDGTHDLIVRYPTLETAGEITEIALFQNTGSADFLAPSHRSFIPTSVTHSLHSPEIVDWDGDHTLDLVAQGTWIKQTENGFLLGNASLVSLVDSFDLLGNPSVIGFTTTGDLDHDGYPDIISTGQGTLDPTEIDAAPIELAVGYNDGAGGIPETFNTPIQLISYDLLGNPGVWGDISIADVDADGFQDLCYIEITGTDEIGNPILTPSWLKNPGPGSRELTTWEVHRLPSDFIPNDFWADLDADGKMEWIGLSHALQPTSSGPIPLTSFAWPNGADFTSYQTQSIQDFDGDGDADFLIGGSNQMPLLLVRNPTVPHDDPLVAILRKAGVVGSLAGLHQDADQDGRNNLTELLEGTDLIHPDPRPTSPYQLTTHTSSHEIAVSYRVPRQAAGLALDAEPLLLSELGIEFTLESSSDLLQWSEVPTTRPPSTEGLWNHHLNTDTRTENQRFYRLVADP